MTMTMATLEALGITRDEIVTRAAELLLEPDGGESVRTAMLAEVKRALAADMREVAEGQIDSLIEVTLADMVDAPFQPVDEWGDKKGKATSLRELVKTKSLEYLTEKVGSDGRPGYNANMSRAAYLAKKAAEDAMTYEVKKEIADAVNTAKSQMRKLVADHITAVLLQSK